VILENCSEWRVKKVKKDGREVSGLIQHPEKSGDASASFTVKMPSIPGSDKLVFKFETVNTAPSENGVLYTVLVNGQEVFKETKTDYQDSKELPENNVLAALSAFSSHRIDLTKWAGQKIKLTLRVNTLGDNERERANWIEPEIRIEH